MVELLVVIFLLALVLGLVIFNGRRGIDNREQDKAAKEIESAINLARQTATNQMPPAGQPANTPVVRLALVSGTGGAEGSWTLSTIGGGNEQAGRLHRSIQLTGAPDLTLNFLSTGGLSANYTITVGSFNTNRTTTISVKQLTGGVTVSQ